MRFEHAALGRQQRDECFTDLRVERAQRQQHGAPRQHAQRRQARVVAGAGHLLRRRVVAGRLDPQVRAAPGPQVRCQDGPAVVVRVDRGGRGSRGRERVVQVRGALAFEQVLAASVVLQHEAGQLVEVAAAVVGGRGPGRVRGAEHQGGQQSAGQAGHDVLSKGKGGKYRRDAAPSALRSSAPPAVPPSP